MVVATPAPTRTRTNRPSASLLPLAVLLGTFFVAPFILIVAYSFGTQAYLDPAVTIGPTLDQYRAVIETHIGVTGRSVALGFGTALACILIGYPVAYVMARRSGRWGPLFLLLAIIPFWTSFLIRAYAWTNILSEGGPLNDVLVAATPLQEPLQILNTLSGISIGMVYAYVPLAILPLYVSIRAVDESVLEAGRDLGQSPMRNFYRVLIPATMPGVVAALVFVAIPAAGEYVVPQVLGGGKTLLLGNVIANQFSTSMNWPLGSALALVGLLSIAVMIAVLYALARPGRSTSNTNAVRNPTTQPTPRDWLVMVGFLAYMYLPIAFVALNAFNADRSLTTWGGFSAEWMSQSIGNPEVRAAFLGSALLALLTTSICLVVGTSAALGIRRLTSARRLVLPLIYAPLLIPEIVLVAALLLWWLRLSLPLGILATAVGQSLMLSALVTLAVLARLESRGPSLEEAAADLGTTRWQTLRRVTVPDVAPALAVSALLCFTLSFDDVVTPSFLAGESLSTIPVLVISRVRFAVGPEVNAIGLLMMLLTAVPLIAALLVTRRTGMSQLFISK